MKAMRSNIAALRAQLKKAEGERIEFDGGNYTNAYRDYKYQEALYELFAKQLELARLDESRESALIQVIDVAEAPEKKSKPKRVILAIQATIATFFILLASAFVTFVWRSWVSDENKAADIKRLQQAWGFARD
jgi:tyrosine-protein kinase Etk/Wzc